MVLPLFLCIIQERVLHFSNSLSHVLLEKLRKLVPGVPKFYLKQKSFRCVLYLYICVCFLLVFFFIFLGDVFELERNFCWETPIERQLWMVASGNDKSIRYTQSDLKGMFWFWGVKVHDLFRRRFLLPVLFHY